MTTIAADRSIQVKAFDETKTGVKGLVDSGIKEIPAMFHAPPSTLPSLKVPPPSKKLTIPTIDLKGGRILDKNQDMNMRRNVVEKIGEAAEKWGFFQVINHGIPLDTLDMMIEAVRGFHEQDQEVKKPFYSRDLTQKIVYYSNIDLFSSVAATWKDSLTINIASGSEDLPEGLSEVNVFILELLSEALGLNPDHLKELGCAKSPSMVGNYYPPCPQPELTLGINNHTDFTFIIILRQSNVRGLQVLHDQDWIDVPPIPGALIVNIGDLLQLLTNDKFISVEHRALGHGHSEARVSVACFFRMLKTASPQAYRPIKELLSEHNPPKYRECSLADFKEFFTPKDIKVSTSSKLQHLRI